jgi:hypothetical protein
MLPDNAGVSSGFLGSSLTVPVTRDSVAAMLAGPRDGSRPRLPAAALLAAMTLAAACGKSSGSSGSPNLVRLSWITRSEVIDLLSLPPGTAPPWPARFEAQFDRQLDGSKIEDGTVDPPRPRPDPPLRVEFEGKTADNFALTVVYVSNARAIWATASPGYPAGARLQIGFDPAGVTSQHGDHLAGPSTFVVDTTPFAVSIGATAPAGAISLARAAALTLAFNNLPRVEELPAAVRVTADGIELPLVMRVDPLDPLRWRVTPAPCLGLWPGGAVLVAAVSTGVADVFGRPLSAPAEAEFTVMTADAGAGGGGACDASAD